MKKFIIALFCFLQASLSYAQYVNGYAKVTAIVGRTLTLSNVDEASDTFEDGENVILMQMQGNVLGNTTNTSNFGDLGGIGAVGKYEVAQILLHTEASGLPATITVVANLKNTYTTDANSSVQIISYPKLGNPDYTTSQALSAKAWDGNVGGVLAFEVTGTLNLTQNLSADGAGFRAGVVSANDGSGCDGAAFIVTSNHTLKGSKGEGIYKSTNTNYNYSMGKLLNGGGGGSTHNGGGGGGGNYTAGGAGGSGWNGTPGGCSPSGGGVGGLGLGSYATNGRVFMGGGGGGGQQNNSVGSSGARGGGIILIKAKIIRTTGSGSLTISANGANAVSSAANDGAGGGGAGGSIVVEVSTWNIAASRPVSVQTNGGNGGSVNDSNVHGGGGGGGQGLVVYSIAPPAAVTTSTNIGTGGCNSSSCATRAVNGVGPANIGIISNTNTPLPMTLTHFAAREEVGKTLIEWQVAAYVPIQYFELEKSDNGQSWYRLARAEATPNRLAYSYEDAPAVQTQYYRLKQVGNAGEIAYSPTIAVTPTFALEQVRLYPNPAKQDVSLVVPADAKITLRNAQGQIVQVPSLQIEQTRKLDVSKCARGLYLVEIRLQNRVTMQKLLIE